MSTYIERDLKEEFFCDVSGTIPVNPDNTSSSEKVSMDEFYNQDRWNWLISNWNNMSFKERMSLFVPYLHYINPRDDFKNEFDSKFMTEIVEMSFTLCRTFKCLHFDPDPQGIPNIIMEFNPIDISCIPDENIKSSVRLWALKYGFLKKNCSACEC